MFFGGHNIFCDVPLLECCQFISSPFHLNKIRECRHSVMERLNITVNVSLDDTYESQVFLSNTAFNRLFKHLFQ